MNVPSVTKNNVHAMYYYLRSCSVINGLKLHYIEPMQRQSGTYYWRVEFKQDSSNHVNLVKFSEVIIEKLGALEFQIAKSINNKRVYIEIEASQDYPLTKRTRRTISTPSNKPPRASGTANNNNNNSKATVLPVSQTFIKGDTIPGTIGISSEKDDMASENRKCANKPIAIMTSKSIETNDNNYALSRFHHYEILNKVRLYLGYLRTRPDDVIVNEHSRLSLELFFMSEGLPIGDKLYELYKEFANKRGITEDRINTDLSAVGSYETTNRIIRLQSAKDKTQEWFGGKNANFVTMPILSHQYYQVKDTFEGRYCIKTIYDGPNEITCFN